MNIKKFLTGICVVGVIFTATKLLAEATVMLKTAEVHVISDKIFLSDIADFGGFDDSQIKQVKALYIKRAAMPGFKLKVTKQYVINRMAKDFQGAQVEGPEEVEVFTDEKEVSWRDIQKTALDYIYENIPWPKESVQVISKQPEGELKLSSGEISFKVREENNINFKGNIIVPVEISINGQVEKIQPVSFMIKVESDCFIAETNLARGVQVTAGSVKKVRRDITYLPDDIIASADELNGMVTKRGIGRGTILLKSMFDITPVFKRGEKVDVIVKIKAITVESTGTAMADGKPGEKVQIKLSNKRGTLVDGKVMPDGKVIIEK